MSAPLLNPLSDLRRTLRRIAVVRGAAMTVACLLALILAVSAIDWWLHIDEANARLSLTCCIGVVAFAGSWRWIIGPAFQRLSDLQIAQRIEAVYPELRGRLSSSVEFASESLPGSAELQQRTVASATERVSELPLQDLPDRRPLQRSVVTAVALAVIAIGVVLVKPTVAAIAIKRLAFPFQSNPWPRTTNLLLITEDGGQLQQDSSLRVVRGEFRELLVENTRGQLPDDAVIEYRVGRDGEPRFETLQPIKLETETKGEVGRAMLSPAATTIFFRAIGGDHKTEWFWLEVVSPPQPKSINVTVVPPKYTGAEPIALPSGDTSIDALVGSEVEIRIRADRFVEAASLMVGGRNVSADVTDNGRRITASFALEKEEVSSWWIDLVGKTGIRNPRPKRYELRCVKDELPTVFIRNPSADLQVTADAVVPVGIVAEDDLAVTELILSGQSARADAVPIQFPTTKNGTEFTAEVRLVELGLQPGDQFALQATARDAFDGDPPHEVTSESRSLVIVTSETKRAELAESQADLLDELSRVVDAQTRARDFVSELRIQQSEAGLRRADLDLLKRTEADQFRIASGLFDETDGLQERLRQTAEAFKANGISAPEIETQLNEVIGELDYIRNEVMPGLQSGLTNARKSVEDTLADSGNKSATDGWLEGTESRQEEIITSLTSVLKNTNSWKKTVDIRSALAELTTQQTQLNRDTIEFGQKTLTSTDNDAKQQAADQARLSRRQQRIAEQLTDISGDIESAIDDLPLDDPATDRLIYGREFLKQTKPSLRLQKAAREIRAGKTSAASTTQAVSLNELNQLAELLDGPITSSADTLAQNLSDVETALAELVDRQGAVKEAIRSDALTAQQQQTDIRTETERQQRRLNRLISRGAAGQAARAIESMREVEQALNSKANDQATAAAEAAESALRDALAATRKDRDQLQQRQNQTEVILALVEISDLAKQQKQLLERTDLIGKAITESGRRTRRQSRELIALGGEQGKLAANVEEVAKDLESFAVITLVLKSCIEHMRDAEALLSSRTAGSETTSQQQAALDALNEVRAAVFPENSDAKSTNESGDQEVTDHEEDPRARNELISVQGRLKLLRSLQVNINKRTAELADSPNEVERTALAERQQRIAELADKLLQELTEAIQ